MLAVTVCAFLASVYLVWDARRLDDLEMVDYFRHRAIAASVVAGFVAFIGFFVLHDYAKYVFDGLTSRALPLVIISAICGIGSLVLLLRDAHTWARVLSMGAVATVVVSWGVAQWPYILPTSLKVSDAAAPTGTLTVDPRRLHPRRDHHPPVTRPPLRTRSEEHPRIRRPDHTLTASRVMFISGHER